MSEGSGEDYICRKCGYETVKFEEDPGTLCANDPDRVIDYGSILIPGVHHFLEKVENVPDDELAEIRGEQADV